MLMIVIQSIAYLVGACIRFTDDTWLPPMLQVYRRCNMKTVTFDGSHEVTLNDANVSLNVARVVYVNDLINGH